MIILAAIAAAADASLASENPQPAPRETLVEAVECHAYTEARLRATAERLGRELRWSHAHQTLEVETRLHEQIGAALEAAADRSFRKALLAAYFPEGVTAGDSEVRVDRWTRCRRLYIRMRAALQAAAG
jgi:hypothetical protein